MTTQFQNLLICLFAVLFFSSCNSKNTQLKTPEHELIAEMSSRARSLAAANPDQALALCDSTETLARTYALADSFDLNIGHTRANAIAAKGMPDSAFSIVSSMYEHKNYWPDTSALVWTLYKMGWYSYIGGHIPAAENFISKTISVMEKANIVKNRANYMTLLADILRDRGKFTEAQDCLFKAVRIAEGVKDTFALGLCYMGIGHVYVGSNSMGKALEYYRKAYESFDELHDREYSVSALTDMGLSYLKSKPDSSLYYYNLALAADSGNTNIRTRVIILFNMGNALAATGQIKKARHCYDKVFDICQKNGVVHGLPKVYSGYGALESSEGNTRKAADYYNQAISLARQSDDHTTTFELMRELLRVYEKAGEWKNYAKLSVETKILEDTLLGAAKKMQLQDIVQSYEIEKREIQNQYLGTALENESQKGRLWLSLLLLFAMAAVVTLGMALINKRLKKGLKSSHLVLMEQYRQERILRKKNQKSRLMAEKQSTTAHTLADYFDAEKPYLNPEIKAADITEALQISYKDFQDAIQELHHHNFKVMLNRYRIQEVTLRFEDPAFEYYTIEAIAKDAGFGSRASFYAAFEAEKGVKPAFYRNQINLPANS